MYDDVPQYNISCARQHGELAQNEYYKKKKIHENEAKKK